MNNIMKAINQIEVSHSGLGRPLILLNLIINAGLSAICLGSKGVGKTRAIKAVYVPKEYEKFSLDSPTLSSMLRRIFGEGLIKDRNFFVFTEDFSALNQYGQEILFKIFSKIISDHTYTKQFGVAGTNSEFYMNIQDCNVVSVIGMTPLTMRRLQNDEQSQYQSMGSDRYLKIAILNGLRNYKQLIDINPIYEFSPILSKDNKIPIVGNLAITRELFDKQVTNERLDGYVKPLIRAYARYEGYSIVTPKVEQEFHDLFWLYFKGYTNSTSSEGIDRESHLNTGAFRLLERLHQNIGNGVTLDNLLSSFSIYKNKGEEQAESYSKYIKQFMVQLEDVEFATYTKNSPYVFQLSPKILGFWDKYRNGAC